MVQVLRYECSRGIYAGRVWGSHVNIELRVIYAMPLHTTKTLLFSSQQFLILNEPHMPYVNQRALWYSILPVYGITHQLSPQSHETNTTVSVLCFPQPPHPWLLKHREVAFTYSPAGYKDPPHLSTSELFPYRYLPLRSIACLALTVQEVSLPYSRYAVIVLPPLRAA